MTAKQVTAPNERQQQQFEIRAPECAAHRCVWLFGAKMKLPDDFIGYLQSGKPRSGELPDFPLWFEIWPDEEMDQWNKDYEVEKYAPGFYGFAGDGGGEMLAFGPDGKVYALPLIGMEPKVAKQLADSWTDLERRIVKK